MPKNEHDIRLSQIYSETNSIKSELKRLNQRLIELEEEENKLRNKEILSRSIRKLPVEIMLMMFQEYIYPNQRLIRRLMLVCRSWYQIVMGSPQLWRRIVVQGPFDPALLKSFVTYTGACIKRSAKLPLAVVFSAPFDNPAELCNGRLYELLAPEIWEDEHSSPKKCFHESMGQICPTQLRHFLTADKVLWLILHIRELQARCVSLSLTYWNKFSMGRIGGKSISKPLEGWTRLERLMISTLSEGLNIIEDWSPMYLRSLRLTFPNWAGKPIRSPLCTLQSLSIEQTYNSWVELYETMGPLWLAMFPNLTSLRIGSCYKDNDYVPTMQSFTPFKATTIISLTLLMYMPSFLLDTLDLPAVQKLTIACWKPDLLHELSKKLSFAANPLSIDLLCPDENSTGASAWCIIEADYFYALRGFERWTHLRACECYMKYRDADWSICSSRTCSLIGMESHPD